MSTDERRKALVDATLPLLREHGTDISTRQIAEAAGIAEGTIFRAYDSKDDLIAACLTEAVSSDRFAAQLDAARADSLRETVTRLLATLDRHHRDVKALLVAFHPNFLSARDAAGAGPASDGPSGADAAAQGACRRPDPAAIRRDRVTQVSALLAPFAAELATPTRVAASYLLALSSGYHHPMVAPQDIPDPALLTQLALRGLTREA